MEGEAGAWGSWSPTTSQGLWETSVSFSKTLTHGCLVPAPVALDGRGRALEGTSLADGKGVIRLLECPGERSSLHPDSDGMGEKQILETREGRRTLTLGPPGRGHGAPHPACCMAL